MHVIDEKLIVSPTDLSGFLACRHLTNLDLRAARKEIRRPHGSDDFAEFLARRGDEHEADYLAELKARGLGVVEIGRPERGLQALRQAEQETLAAMRAGAHVIFQATFFDGAWRGHADFLVKVDTPSDLGAYSYEVQDAKLSRRPKGRALLQLCQYSRQLERLQGAAPEFMHLVLGTKEVVSFRIKDYEAYFRTVSSEFTDAIQGPIDATYPDPVEHCSICVWNPVCTQKRRDDDHLSQVAEMRRDQIKKLVLAGVETMQSLGELTPGAKVAGIPPTTLDRLQDQAAMQVAARTTGTRSYKVLEPIEPEKGLGRLPKPSPFDLFFDIEADPYAEAEGLEFLFGVVELKGDSTPYRTWWAHDPLQEKAMLEQFIDFVMARFIAHPEMHVYHYAPYETGALKRLVGRHCTKANELDVLLRAGVFVDLYQVVRQGLRISEDSYSIKRLEAYYNFVRTDDITQGGNAMLEYERYIETEDPTILQRLADYNEMDCLSMVHLQAWLEERRTEAETIFSIELPRPVPHAGEPHEELKETDRLIAQLRTALRAGIPEGGPESDEDRARVLLGDLLGWHRRDAKSDWWLYYARRDMTQEQRVEDSDCLGGLSLVKVFDHEKQSATFRFSFPPQEHKIGLGRKPIDPATEKSVGNIVMISDDDHFIDIRKRADRTDHPESIIPPKPFNTDVQQASLRDLATQVLEGGMNEADSSALQLLMRQAPRTLSQPALPIGTDETTLDAACRIATQLDRSYLSLQGPPGTGKTYTGAHMILTLCSAGKKVGVTATSHKVISNLLTAVVAAAKESGVSAPKMLQKCDDDQEPCDAPCVTTTTSNDTVLAGVHSGEYQLFAGTSWLFSRSDLREGLHTLFIDEAGQFALANAVAVAPSATNLVLLGDPQQLAQPTRGLHPPGSELSVLGHVLGEELTLPEDKGLFLETSWRMHPDVCSLISEVFYEGKLSSHPNCSQQVVADGGSLSGAGLYLIEIDHDANRTTSSEEATTINALINGLGKARWTDFDGDDSTLDIDEILTVAPYNAQVGLLRRTLPDGARVGTVDKFQGQEAAVTFYSMATSTSEDIPRNFAFLFSHNRLNVATSRARAVAVLACSKALFTTRCHSPAQMRLVNALCRFREMASEQGHLIKGSSYGEPESLPGRG